MLCLWCEGDREVRERRERRENVFFFFLNIILIWIATVEPYI
jgi:hypothetical protein